MTFICIWPEQVTVAKDMGRGGGGGGQKKVFWAASFDEDLNYVFSQACLQVAPTLP